MDHRNKLYRLFRRNRLEVLGRHLSPKGITSRHYSVKQKKEYFHHLIKTMAHPSVLWKTLKAAGVSSSPQKNWSYFNTNTSSDADTLNKYFVAVSSASSASLPCPAVSVPQPQSKLSLTSTTPAWYEESLASLKPRYTPGLDGIPSSALIAGRSGIGYPQSSILNFSISCSVFPVPGNVLGLSPCTTVVTIPPLQLSANLSPSSVQ